MSRKKDRNANHDPSYYARRTGGPEQPQDRLPSSRGHRGGAKARGAGTDRGSADRAFRAVGYTVAGTSASVNPLDDGDGDDVLNRAVLRANQAAITWNFNVLGGFGVSTPSAPSKEFGGKEFAAGVARGARSFRVDALGRLTGVSYRVVWTPGENEATCKASTSFVPCGGIDKCAHGFYAYYDSSDDYHDPGMVSGVIEGYGEAVIGTRGFRAMKARIVALHIPEDVKPALARMVRRNYPEIPVFDTFEHMVSEFTPDDGGEGITPTSDPDFWTREI